jgi:hypothetical protein
MMLETTGLCPFYETCDTPRDRTRIEKKLLKEKRKFLFETSYLERVEYNELMSDYQRKFTSLNRIEDRCSSNHIRCLRFWQKSRHVNKDEKSGQPAHDWIKKSITG